MFPLLTTLRQTAPLSPEKYLAAHPGCWLQYYDDTPAKDPAKALSARAFDPELVRRKQDDRCAVAYSLQAFGESRTKEGLLCFRNMGVDVDLVAASERGGLHTEEIDRRKEAYLERVLLPLPLRPHWIVESRHGLHLVFRVLPLRQAADVEEALGVNRRLVAALRGDPNATLLTQVLRVPGTLQFKGGRFPFLCRLLLDHSDTVVPHDLQAVRRALGTSAPQATHGESPRPEPSRWKAGLAGVPEGERNATAASVVGALLSRLPVDLWETGGWGGLKEWNARNQSPLPAAELRAVFRSVARRENDRRRAANSPSAHPPACLPPSDDADQ